MENGMKRVPKDEFRMTIEDGRRKFDQADRANSFALQTLYFRRPRQGGNWATTKKRIRSRGHQDRVVKVSGRIGDGCLDVFRLQIGTRWFIVIYHRRTLTGWTGSLFELRNEENEDRKRSPVRETA